MSKTSEALSHLQTVIYKKKALERLEDKFKFRFTTEWFESFEREEMPTGKELTVKYCGSNIRHETKASAMKAAKKLSRLYEPNRYTVCKCLSCSYWHVKQIKLMDEVEEGSF